MARRRGRLPLKTCLRAAFNETSNEMGMKYEKAPAADVKHNWLPDRDSRVRMLREMMRIRLVEEEIVRRYGEQEMRCPTHICIGQEAPPVGVSMHLRQSDLVFSAHRSHGHYLAKGADLRAMIAELYGKETGCARGKGGSQHLVDLDAGFMGSAPILASTISVGVGAAWQAKRKGADKVCAIYFGDGATEEGAFHEALNFAGVNRLPVVFVCENNLYSVHTPLNVRQPSRPIADLARTNGMSGCVGDGNDADEVWRLGGAAVESARRGEGPTLIELMTYRWKEHVGPGDDEALGYRSAEELASWQARCPVTVYQGRLIAEGVLDAAAVGVMKVEIEAEIDDAFRFAKTSSFPASEELARHVFPSHLEVTA
jgi:pyruvate dehydrogenase E1 component alpha subunit